jgi:hypothetical protein
MTWMLMLLVVMVVVMVVVAVMVSSSEVLMRLQQIPCFAELHALEGDEVYPLWLVADCYI